MPEHLPSRYGYRSATGTTLLEVPGAADADHARRQDVVDPQPLRAQRLVELGDRVGVEGVEHVEVEVQNAVAPDRHLLFRTQVDDRREVLTQRPLATRALQAVGLSPIDELVDQAIDQGGEFGLQSLHSPRCESLLRKLNFEPDDIFTAVNGVSLNNPFEALDALKSLTTADRIQVTFMRNGAEQTQDFQL